MARQTLYTPELAEEMLRRMSGGEPLAEICRDDHMPAVSTVSGWKKAHPDFAQRFNDARDNGYDMIAADCMRIADSTQEGETTTTKEWGTETKKGDMLEHRKLRVWTRLQLLAKWDPRRYGDKQQIEHSGELTVNGLAGRMRTRRGDTAATGVEDLV